MVGFFKYSWQMLSDVMGLINNSMGTDCIYCSIFSQHFRKRFVWSAIPEHLHLTTLSSLDRAALTKDSPNAVKACLYILCLFLIDSDNFSPCSKRPLTQQINPSKGENEALR